MVDEEKILEALKALGISVSDSVAAIAKRCDDIEAKLAAKKADDDETDDLAEKTAADSVLRSELRVMRDQVNSLVRERPSAQTQATRDAFADCQAKADVAYRSLGESAPMPMAGEDLVAFQIRTHRPLMKHSKKFKDAELHVLARDVSTFNAVLDSVRTDAYAAGLTPVGLAPFQYREIKSETAGGHKVTTFVGNGTCFKQMSRPVRHVHYIGADDRYPRMAGGSVYAPGRGPGR
jgi:hypothetical protein